MKCGNSFVQMFFHEKKTVRGLSHSLALPLTLYPCLSACTKSIHGQHPHAVDLINNRSTLAYKLIKLWFPPRKGMGDCENAKGSG